MQVPVLAHTMRINAVFSASSGVVAIVLAVAATTPLGLQSWLLAVIGAGLIGYGIELGLASRRAESLEAAARFATIADAAWVVAAGIVLVAFPAALDTTGRVVLTVTSLIVADLALLQYLGLRGTRAARLSVGS